MTPAFMGLVAGPHETALCNSFRLLQGVWNLPRLFQSSGQNRGLNTPHRTVFAEGPMRVLQFRRQSPHVWAEPLLICSAPVSRPCFLDLSARRSVVGRMLAAGFDTYLIDWGNATAVDRNLRLSDLVDPMLKRSVQFLRQRSRMPHLHLMGYCLGGTLAAIFTALYPGVVKDLVLMAAPIDLGDESSLLQAWTKAACLDIDSMIDTFGGSPGSLLRAILALVDPVRTFYGNYGELATSMHDKECVESFVALQRWATARVSVAGGVFRDIVELIYRRNLLAQGKLAIHGIPVRLDRIGCAVLLLTASGDRLVPPPSTIGVASRICSREVRTMSIDGGHERLVVSSRVYQDLWPDAARWIADHSVPRTGPWIRPGEASSGRPEFLIAEKGVTPSERSAEPIV